ncbi:GNAT family N-acetyltransferase [Paenibacillus polysaccharolyticus]|uniref:GNAT family N-acetyltransferase n=1 Tax=Paenibacillus polysaccharolyticus TaxID=582692 RepID=UPI00209D7079|nr:GNAT family protein [Paenibacillus polysaccharolyticus]MCP1133523.1 GNAT family N-acetyltransferase [Paenibacillus polysaccharolyticus]
MSHEGFPGQEEVWIQLVGVSSFASLLATRRGVNQELAAITGLLHGCYLYRTGINVFPGPNSADTARQLLRGLQLFSEEELYIILNSIFVQEACQQVQGSYEEILKDAIHLHMNFSPVRQSLTCDIDLGNRKAEIGYWLGQEYEGNGLITKAVNVLIEHAFEQLGLNKVEIGAATDNRRSRAIPEKLGFQREGELRDYEFLNGRFLHRVMYGLRTEEWHSIDSQRD